MTNFISNLKELYSIWLTASLYPKFMMAILFLSPVIFTVTAITIVNYRIAKRAWGRNQKRLRESGK